ncbi:MAG: type II toxin-antitoxin system HicB family antitoxin [Acidobacteria bacterium]|nr:type II toxin-antitoxin system HicB family antitoxin [Acidobacteriota bacterium]
MQIAVLIEPCTGQGYRATSLTLPGVSAEAPTREEALTRLKDNVQQRLAQGEVAQLEVPLPGEPHPLMAVAGSLKSHPDFDEWVQNMKEYRRQIDADPDRQ